MMIIVSLFLVLFVLNGFGLAREPTLLGKDVLKSPIGGGVLKPLGNAHLLQLFGSPYEKGLAHGYLLADQIIDWLYFYQIQTNMKGNTTYYERYASWLKENQHVPDDYAEEANGLFEGMKKSGRPLFIDILGRDFVLNDIYVLNTYLEGTPASGALYSWERPDPTTLSHKKPTTSSTFPACTQFVAWGDMTGDGGTLAGRNMDGEIDPWYVTVSHLIVFAHSATGRQKRFVSVMWPGHIGSLSTMNEDGLSIMLNCGSLGPGDLATNITAIEYTIRHLASTYSSKEATPSNIWASLQAFQCSTGGYSAAGSVLVFSRPSHFDGQLNPDPAFVAEIDRYGGLVRRFDSNFGPEYGNIQMVAESNHFLQYGVDFSLEDTEDFTNPKFNFGQENGFSSRWRLQAVKSGLESLNRTSLYSTTTSSAGSSNLPKNPPPLVGLGPEYGVAKILRYAAHGQTEHSIGFAPEGLRSSHASFRKGPIISLANADPYRNQGMQWDAPYLPLVEYSFDELFE